MLVFVLSRRLLRSTRRFVMLALFSRQQRFLLMAIAGCCVLSLASHVEATERSESSGPVEISSPIDFARDIYPVLKRSCFECHGVDKQESSLRLDVKANALSSSVLEVGSPDNSELVRRISLPRGHDEVMPVLGDPLNPREVTAIRLWIEQGAQWPEDFEAPPHWAYVTPQRPIVPTVSDPDWMQSAVDAFVLARLDELGLKSSPRAEAGTLLRRIHLDLIGLPPTLREVEAFESDSSPASVQKLVEELMSRPQFGERWARPWLDLARYADSHGFQRDDFRDSWAYRDWVITALNKDLPFNQFTIEQLAGDLLPGATESQRIATGFHRCSPTNCEAGSLPEETRIEQVIDRVNTTASVWLGSTLECAQCHDHKYDPFTSKDYYRFLAFFNSTELEADRQKPDQPSSIAFIGPTMPLSDTNSDTQRTQILDKKVSFTNARRQRRDELNKDLAAWSTETSSTIAEIPQQHSIEVVDFESLGNTDSYRLRDDGAVLLVGSDPPSKDTYTITAKLTAGVVRAFRLDALTDESLPGSGPGRGDSVRSNFVLNELTVSLLDDAGAEKPLRLVDAKSDFSQANWDVVGAIDENSKSGWAISPQFARPHWATFILDSPLDTTAGVELRFKLHQNFGNARTLGCLKISAISGSPNVDSVPKSIVNIIASEPNTWTRKQREQLLDYRMLLDPQSVAIDQDLASIQQELDALKPETTLVMVELPQPRMTNIFLRGDYRSPGDHVTAGVPEFLHRLDHTNEGELNRLDLAKWLVNPSNPLVARVTVNRWWSELFGEGLVRTPEDFGLKGESPTHSELLDWLAVEFVENGWSMKHLLKVIVTSATYQQSSKVTQQLAELDDQNRLLARGPRVRLSAESIRDNAMSISGLICLKQFGPPIRPYQPDGLWAKVGGQNYQYVVSPGDEKYRRGVYVVLKRGAPYPSFVSFDANNRFACTIQRSRTNTPLQALTLLNDPVFVEAAKTVGVRAASTAKQQSVESTIVDEFRRCTARSPLPEELTALSELYHLQSQRYENVPFGAKQLAAEVALPNAVTESEFAAWFDVATVLMNLHETITKE